MNRGRRRNIDTKYIEFGDLTKYINIQPSSDLDRNEYKYIFKTKANVLGYTKGTFYIVTAKYTDEFLGIIGLDCEYFKSENGEKFENNSKYKTEIKGFYVTPNMKFSKETRRIILRNVYLDKINVLLTTIQKYSEYVQIMDEPMTGIFNKFHDSWCREYCADQRKVYALLIDPKAPITDLDISELDIGIHLIHLLEEQGITTIMHLLECAGDFKYNSCGELKIVCDSLHRYIASRYIDALLNIEINRG
jgi:hypothetical protein